MTESITHVVARAHPNIALIKYWGKRDTTLNLPAVSSLSITLDTLQTETTLTVNSNLERDQLVLNDAPASDRESAKIASLCDHFRSLSSRSEIVSISSKNNFPTAAGLASSASGFAALVVGLDTLFETKLSESELSRYARLGSGSAARSVFGGYTTMNKGTDPSGEDAIAEAFLPADHWPLAVAVAITSNKSKSISSTQGMEATRNTSPYYQNWVSAQEDDMSNAKAAIQRKDFSALAELSEYSCLKMHGLMMSAQPGLLYWHAATLACLHEIRTMRSQGVPVFFTVDAGPQVKAICEPQVLDTVTARLAAVDGVHQVIEVGLGGGATAEVVI